MEVKEILESVNKMTKSRKLQLVEEILRDINKKGAQHKKANSLLDFAGIMPPDEAIRMSSDIKEGRKIDINEW